MPELRPLVIVHPHSDEETELTAAQWNRDKQMWVSNDGRRFDGNSPAEADDLVVVMTEPETPVGELPDTELFDSGILSGKEALDKLNGD